MTDQLAMHRRAFLLRSAALGCSAAASPLVTPVALASAPWDARLVVIILRGGMDGLDAVRPVGDPGLTGLRPNALTVDETLPLDGMFGLHPALADLMPMWQAGELAFAHAVSTPYRDKRSHFDGQDLLEAGSDFAPGVPMARDGWLNRMLQTVPGIEAETAYAIGQEDLLVLRGAQDVATWAPRAQVRASDQAQRLLSLLYEGDPLFHASAEEAFELSALTADAPDLAELMAGEEVTPEMQDMMARQGRNAGHLHLAQFAAERLRGDTRIAAFSLNGWDTHRRQARGIGRALTRLSEVLTTLQAGLGSVWGKTTVLAMTEFGRTARENGTQGTDHGTAGAMVMAGGAVRGGQVHTRWPGLEEGDLYDRRDLMPTEDVRAYAAGAMQGLFGLDRGVLETAVFPGLDMGQVGRIIL